MPFPLTENVRVERDTEGRVHVLEHLQQPFMAAAAAPPGILGVALTNARAATPRELADEYLRAVASIYGFSDSLVPAAAAAPNVGAAEPASESRLQPAPDKEMLGTVTVNYQQFFKGIPVWRAGTSVTVQSAPMRVTASHSTVRPDVSLSLAGAGEYKGEALTAKFLKVILNVPAEAPLLITKADKLYVYRYAAAQRRDPAATENAPDGFEAAPPTLPLPPVPNAIQEGQDYVVSEVLFSLPSGALRDLNWRALVEVNTGTVLYLRAFVACASGLIFPRDPATVGNAATPNSPASALNPLRSRVNLSGISSGVHGSLTGAFVKIVDVGPPTVTPPTVPDPPADFDFAAPTREFAAVNAYHHCDGLFRRMEDMGFNVSSYFDGTTFPVRVDPCALNDQLNAQAPGNALGEGSDGFRFGLAGSSPAVGIAADVRVVLHEFGHTLLWDNVHSPNFGFAHSAGDSLAAILSDPDSSLRADPTKRFATFPWILPNRRHDRDVAAGWGWDGARYDPFGPGDGAGYIAEQILSTTLFRFYRSIGGDSADLAVRQTAARRAVYLIFRAIGTLTPSAPTTRPESFVSALMNADIGTADFEGYKGGVVQKVLRWAFEKQGLYQSPGTPKPVTASGAAPLVDVYIDDGRKGEYDYDGRGVPEVWNRLAQSAGSGPADHQSPVAGQPNFLYVQVHNRGSKPAAGVAVTAYVADSSSGLNWPADFTVSGGPVSITGGVPAGGAVIAGPIAWTPAAGVNATILVAVSADMDLSNIDPRTFFPCVAGPVPAADLTQCDNNLALRSLTV
jgi:hypothetical protein